MSAPVDPLVARHAVAAVGPEIGRRGLVAQVVYRPSAAPGAGPASALSHASTATGWSLGQDAAGAARLVVGTATGPVALSAGTPVPAGAVVRLTAHLPGELGDDLVLRVEPLSPDAPAAAEARVALGSAILTSRGPVLRGCREFGTDRRPLQVFAGEIRDILVVADADAADGDLADHARLVIAAPEAVSIPDPEGDA